MKPNITMTDMPSSSKNTIGVLLAKRLGFSFADMDIVIQKKKGRLLKEIIAQEGMDGFLKVEERINAGLDVALSVIAPSRGVIYGKKATEHLKGISEVVYLKMSYEEMEKRIGNAVDRDIALKPGFALRDPCNEHVPYYEKYADTTIDEEEGALGDTVGALRDVIERMMDRSMIERIAEERKEILEGENRRTEAYEAETAILKEELALLRTVETVQQLVAVLKKGSFCSLGYPKVQKGPFCFSFIRQVSPQYFHICQQLVCKIQSDVHQNSQDDQSRCQEY